MLMHLLACSENPHEQKSSGADLCEMCTVHTLTPTEFLLLLLLPLRLRQDSVATSCSPGCPVADNIACGYYKLVSNVEQDRAKLKPLCAPVFTLAYIFFTLSSAG